MKRFLKIAGILFAVLLVLVIIALAAGFIFLKNLDVKKYKPQIIEAASESLGRPVVFKDIDLKVSLDKGIRFHLSDFVIAENPEFGSGNFVTVAEIEAGVDILPFLQSRRISVPNVLVRSPRIDIIRNPDGALNVQTLGQSSSESASSDETTEPSSTAALPAIFIDSLRIENAEVYLTDKSVQPELELAVTQVSLDVQKFSLMKPFSFSLEGAILSSQKNLHVTGNAQLNLAANAATISDTNITLDLNGLPLAELRTFPLLAGIPLPQVLEGQIEVGVKEATVSDQRLGDFHVSVALTNGTVQAAEIVPGISVDARQVNLAVQNLSSDTSVPAQVAVKAALYQDQPNVDFTSRVSVDPKTMGIRLTDGQFVTDLSLWPLETLKSAVAPLKDIPFPEELSGTVRLAIKDVTASAEGLQSILLDVALENATVALNEIAPGISVMASRIQVDVTDFTLTEPFDISGSLAYESEEPNVSFGGKGALDLETQNVQLSEMFIKTDLAKIPMARLKEKILPLKDAPLPEVLKGQLDVNIGALSAGPQGLGAILADVRLSEGEVTMKDVAPGISFSATQLNADVKGFSLGSPFTFDLQMAYLNDQPNIATKGTATFSLETQNVTLNDTTANIDLGLLSMTELKASVAPLKDVPLPEMLKGDLAIVIKEATAGPKGLVALSAHGSLKNWGAKLKELAVPVGGTETNFTMTESRFTTTDLNVTLGQGQITAKADVTDYMTALAFDVAGEIKSLNLAEILNQKDAPVKVEGLIAGAVKASGRAADMTSIAGDGNLEVTDAKLKDMNVLKMVLDKISFLPDVAARVEAGLPEKYKEKLKSQDTEIQKVSTSFLISQGVIKLDPVLVQAEEFVFSGVCTAGFDQTYALDGSVKIPAELSLAMANGVEELKYLYDENSTISLPVRVTGKGGGVPAVAVTQMAIDMGKNILRTEGTRQLEKLLNKAIGGNTPPENVQDPAEQDAPLPDEPTPAKSPESQIIDGIFNSIFK